MKKMINRAGLLLIAALLYTCKKDFLNVKPDKALLVPATLSDFRALLDNNKVFNITPGLTGIADGDFYTPGSGWSAWTQDSERNSYIWAPDIFVNSTATDWALPYQQIFYANVVLDGLPGIKGDSSGSAEFRAVKGTALFHRAYAFFNLAQQFAVPYNAATASKDLGLPLKLGSDVNERPQRSSVEATYARILLDLREARALLPGQSVALTRPTVTAAYALLARIALAMGNYDRAGLYADSALAMQSTLIDYNTISTTATRPFPIALPANNAEVVFYSACVSYSFANSSSQTMADTVLYRSYAAGDLRQAVLFKTAAGNNGKFKGSYSGYAPSFSGLAVDELYLIRAEARARKGDAAGAMADLNTLLAKRWKTGVLVPLSATGAADALHIVIAERRKELVGRNLRWTDLRRLNADPGFAVTLNRNLGENSFTLLPGSNLYTYPIPPDELRLNGLAQNPR